MVAYFVGTIQGFALLGIELANQKGMKQAVDRHLLSPAEVLAAATLGNHRGFIMVRQFPGQGHQATELIATTANQSVILLAS